MRLVRQKAFAVQGKEILRSELAIGSADFRERRTYLSHHSDRIAHGRRRHNDFPLACTHPGHSVELDGNCWQAHGVSPTEKPRLASWRLTDGSDSSRANARTAGRSRRARGMTKSYCSWRSGRKPRLDARATGSMAAPQSARPCATAAATALCERA